MTSKEIEATPAINLSDKSWLKEIAYQLALLNENREKSGEIPAKVPANTRVRPAKSDKNANS